ncbi:MAG: SWIM zinc finger family protein [Burkholderiales bacterium]
MSWRDFPYFKPSTPRATTGGIKAQSKQGSFGKNWWAKRWIAVLDGFQLVARLARGRSYARRGQVLEIQVATGLITAKVQGSRPRPYAVEIKVKTLSNADGAKLGKALAKQALFAAKLLAGEMPQDIEQAFTGVGLSLFPARLDDLKTQCSCPDWSNPCKHIAAVYYLMGEEFDRDPFLIFKLRGVDRDRLTALLGRATRAASKPGSKASTRVRDKSSLAAEEPIDVTTTAFWEGKELSPGWLGEVRTPPLQAALLKRLGSFPFWRGNERFADALVPVYKAASESAQELWIDARR